MKNWILGGLILLAAAVMAFAGTAPHTATVTYTLANGTSWSDTGTLVGMHAMPSPIPGYTLIVFDFEGHQDVFHLDDGNVGLTLR